MTGRLFSCADSALLVTLSHAQFVAAKPDRAVEAALKAEIERFGWTGLKGDPRLLRAAAKVRADRPLDAAQAATLAHAYFSIRTGSCGGVGSPMDRGAFWSFSTQEGYVDRLGAAIEIAKAMGKTFSKGFVTVDRPSDFSWYILPDAVLEAIHGGLSNTGDGRTSQRPLPVAP